MTDNLIIKYKNNDKRPHEDNDRYLGYEVRSRTMICGLLEVRDKEGGFHRDVIESKAQPPHCKRMALGIFYSPAVANLLEYLYETNSGW